MLKIIKNYNLLDLLDYLLPVESFQSTGIQLPLKYQFSHMCINWMLLSCETVRIFQVVFNIRCDEKSHATYRSSNVWISSLKIEQTKCLWINEYPFNKNEICMQSVIYITVATTFRKQLKKNNGLSWSWDIKFCILKHPKSSKSRISLSNPHNRNNFKILNYWICAQLLHCNAT